MRLIDAEQLKAVLEKNFGHTGGASVLEQLIDEQPTIEPSTSCSEIPNSSDTVSRQAAIDALAKIAREKFNLSDEYNHYLAGLMDGELAIKGLPTIQTKPKEGHWIRTDCGLDVECKCSRCGYKDFVEPRDEYWFKRNYCPNCGAKMINK